LRIILIIRGILEAGLLITRFFAARNKANSPLIIHVSAKRWLLSVCYGNPVWAVEEERVPGISDIPASVLANMTHWNVELLQRRWEKKRREREELLGNS